jgi:hypothetical protein
MKKVSMRENLVVGSWSFVIIRQDTLTYVRVSAVSSKQFVATSILISRRPEKEIAAQSRPDRKKRQ